MPIMKTVTCPQCEGIGYIPYCTECYTDTFGNNFGSVCNKLCSRCVGKGTVEEPMTNGDKIRSMSDAEIANVLLNHYSNGYECHGRFRTDEIYEEIKGWLQEEYNAW